MSDPNPQRRDVLRLAGLLGAGAAVAASPAHAKFTYAPDIVVFCSPTLKQPVRLAADLHQSQTGVPVHILAPPDRIAAAQLERGERNDICILLAPVAAALQRSGLAEAQPLVGTWRDRLVIARLGPGPAPVEPGPLLASAPSRLGVVDAGEDALVDTAALLDRLGLAAPLAGRLSGSLDSGGVAFALAHRAVEFGLIFATDANAGPFTVAATIPDAAYEPVRYAALLNRHVLSRNAAGFLAFLATPPARRSLIRSGLEIET